MGRNLTVSSLPDTGKASGREYDASLTVTVGYGASVSGSVGYGETNGQTNWVNRQTGITAADSLNIRTGNHTQLDGAVLASDNGNLKLYTGSLGFRDIAGEDRERGYYLNVGGTYGLSNGASGSTNAQQDPSQVGKGKTGVSGWSVEGYDYQKDREQIVRATVGAGEVTVRQDTQTGQDSTAGLNRDKDHSSEITKDESSRTDFYASDSSIKAVSQPTTTAKDWAKQLTEYNKTAAENFTNIGLAIGNQIDAYRNPGIDAKVIQANGAETASQTLSALLEAGIPRDKAQGILASENFQSEVLDALKGISDYGKDGQLEKTRQGLAEAGIPEVVQLEDMNIEGKPDTLAEVVLDRASQINAYIKEHPDQAEAVGLVMAAAQGPKGLILLAVNSVISQTTYAEKVKEAVGEAGQYVAESLQKTDLDAKDEYGNYLVGGGTLIATTLLGIAGAKALGAGKKIIVNKEDIGGSHGAITDNQSGLRPGHPIKITTSELFDAANSPFKNGQSISNAGRAATKHPEYFGFSSTKDLRSVYRTDAQLNELASKTISSVLAGGTKTTGAGGRYPNGWITYTLPDGRAASWASSGEFIGFRGLRK